MANNPEKEKVDNEFIEELKNRISNPFLFSFVIAWLIYNWYIPLILIFYSQEELSFDGKFYSYTQAISEYLRYHHNIQSPILIALGYVAFMPIIKGGIDWWQSIFARIFGNKVNEQNNKLKTYALIIAEKDRLYKELDQAHKELTLKYKETEQDLSECREQLHYAESRREQSTAIRGEVLGTFDVQQPTVFEGNEEWVIDINGVRKQTPDKEEPLYRNIKLVGNDRDVVFVLKHNNDGHLAYLWLAKNDTPGEYSGTLEGQEIKLTKIS